MEKAWAKTVGSYERIVGGLCVDAFGTFTGLPSRSFYHRDNDCDEVFEWLFHADRKDYAIHCSSKPGAENEQERENGICYCHAYTVISVHKAEL